MTTNETKWWQKPESDEMECHTARVWDQIAKAAEAAGDLERAKEAREACEREANS